MDHGAARGARLRLTSHRRRRMSSSNENFALLVDATCQRLSRAARALSSRGRRVHLLRRARARWSTAGRLCSAARRRPRRQRRDLAAEQPRVRRRVPRDAAARCDRRAPRRSPQGARGPRPARDRASGGAGHHARARARAGRRRAPACSPSTRRASRRRRGPRTAPVARAGGRRRRPDLHVGDRRRREGRRADPSGRSPGTRGRWPTASRWAPTTFNWRWRRSRTCSG